MLVLVTSRLYEDVSHQARKSGYRPVICVHSCVAHCVQCGGCPPAVSCLSGGEVEVGSRGGYYHHPGSLSRPLSHSPRLFQRTLDTNVCTAGDVK